MADEDIKITMPEDEVVDEVKDEVVDEVKDEVIDEPQFSAKEKQAMEQGWRPKEEFEGDPEDWVSAGEFIRRGELFKAIHKANRRAKELEETINQLSEHHKRTAEVEYKRAMEDLKAAKKQALEADDYDAVVELDEKMADAKAIKEQIDEAPAPQTNEQAEQAFDNFVKDNSWYVTDDEMRDWADTFGLSYAQGAGRGKPIDEIFDYVAKEAKHRFSDRFSNPQRKKAAAVSAPTKATTRASSKTTYTEADLNDEQRHIMNKFVRSGALTKEQYIAELAAQGGISK
jgi:hypothetical protein